jgi:hypothetical protein
MSALISTEEKEARKARYEAVMAELRRDRAAARARGELELARRAERRAHQRQVAAALSGGLGGGSESPTSSASASELEAVSSQRSALTIAELTAYWLPPRESSSGGVVDVRGGGGGHGSSVSEQALSAKVPAQQQGQANNPQVSPVTTFSLLQISVHSSFVSRYRIYLDGRQLQVLTNRAPFLLLQQQEPNRPTHHSG